jgi:hypothetical protein
VEPVAGNREGKKSLDGRFAEEVELAHDFGVAPSLLLGRQPVERHEHYNSRGVLTGVTVVTHDPVFTRDDVTVLLAHRRKKAEAEPLSYGIPLSEAMDAANQFAFKGPKAPTVDYAEKAFKDALDAWFKAHPNANRNGLKWGPVTRRE